MNHEIETARIQLENEIALQLNKMGLFFRIFSRAKSIHSIDAKLGKGNRRIEGKKIQDLIGLRVVCYFRQDEVIVEKLLKRMYVLDNESVTDQSADTFAPTRKNFVFKISDSLRLPKITDPLIDRTFEVQIRTVFSEGWHEVEHDVRYKHPELWGETQTNRALNSVYATLEMCDWGIERIMSEMAYSGYKSGDFIKMITGKFMLRLSSSDIKDELAEILQENEIRKAIFKADRNKVIDSMSSMRSIFPITASLVVYVCNHIIVKDARISELMPIALSDAISRLCQVSGCRI